MRILQLNSVFGVGSTSRMASDQNNLLVQQSYKSYVKFWRKKAKNCVIDVIIGSSFDVGRNLLKTMILSDHGYGSKIPTEKFIKSVRSNNPGIIYITIIHGFYLNIEELFTYLKAKKKFVVWTLYDCWSFIGHCAYFYYVECNKWVTSCFSYHQRKAYPFISFRDNSSAHYVAKKGLFNGLDILTLVTPSAWMSELVNNSNLGKCEFKTIHSGIDFSAFRPRHSDARDKHGLTDRFIILGFANIWKPKKVCPTSIN